MKWDFCEFVSIVLVCSHRSVHKVFKNGLLSSVCLEILRNIPIVIYYEAFVSNTYLIIEIQTLRKWSKFQLIAFGSGVIPERWS